MKRIKHGGRQAGTPNKMTSEIRAKLQGIVTREIDILTNQLHQMTTKERLDFIAKILPYILPRLESIQVTDTKQIRELTPRSAGEMSRDEILDYLDEMNETI